MQSKIEARIANSRGAATLASLREELGPSIVPQCLQDALEAEVIFIAVPFSAHKSVAERFKHWSGTIVADLTNAFRVTPEELGGLLSSEVVSKAFVGARLVKAFSHLPAEQLGTNPNLPGQRQAVFVSSNDDDASATIAAVATQLGFAPVELGKLNQGGTALHLIAGKLDSLLFQTWSGSAKALPWCRDYRFMLRFAAWADD